MSDTPATAPSIRGFQFDSSSLGSVSKSVNLFRGEVDLPVTFASLSGPNGLDVTVAAMYTSSVQQQVNAWNQTAPTSILGMGWSMPFDIILVSGKVSASAGDGTFYYVDRGNPRQLTCLDAPSSGSWTYALQNYEFWSIERAVTSESDVWTVTKEDGRVYTFGGPGATQTAAMWATANWVGAGVATGSSAYPLCWNLSSVTDVWGNSITYSYLFDNQPVPGSPTLQYTQACYLETITDPLGRTVSFQYLPKESSEYDAPLPAQYQNRYETNYLDGIVVTAASGEDVLSIQFDYELADLSSEGTGSNGICTKRYLTGATQANPAGQSLPGVQFSYVGLGDGTQPGTVANWGALSSVTYPTGGVASYQYTAQALPVTNCSTTVDSFQNAWFGPTYAVLTECTASQLNISVMTWNGSWIAWPLSESINGSFSDVQVVTAGNFFAVCAANGQSTYQLFLYGQDPANSGGWVANSNGAITLAYTYSSSADLWLAAGDSFVVVGVTNSPAVYWLQQLWQNNPGYQFDNWGTPAAVTPVAQQNIVALAAVDDGFLTGSLSGTTVSFNLCATSATGGFGAPVSLGSITASNGFELAAGNTYAVVAYANSTASFDVELLSFNAALGTGSSTALATGLSTNAQNAWPVTPVLIGNTLIACGPYLWRFDGSVWNSYTMASAGPPFAYGTDIVIGTDSNGNSVAAQFSPASGNWSAVPALTGNAGQPTASGTCVTIGNNVWMYGESGGTWSWTQLANTLGSGVTAGSVLNAAPSFIVAQTASGVALTLLQNGQLVAPQSQPAGTLLGAGTFAFATSSSGNIQLYSVVNEAYGAPLVAYAVSSLSVDDGFTTTTTNYQYDAATATFDPLGRIAQYSHAFAVPATNTGFEQSSPTNCTESYFLNGLGSSTISYPSCSGCSTPSTAIPASLATALFNGMLAQTNAYDDEGNVAASTTYYWYALPNSPTPGLYARCFRTSSTLDGVPNIVDQTFDPSSGGVLTSTTYNTLASGSQETITTAYTYWYQQYDTAQTLNLLAPVVQTTVTNVTGGAATVVSASVTTWQDWNDAGNCPQSASATGSQWAPYRSYVLSAAPNGTAVTFPDWCNQSDPQSIPGWQLMSEVTSRAADGVVVESVDAMGSSQSTIYGGTNGGSLFQTASFANASIAAGEASYLGFEAYESSQSWTYDPNDVVDTNAHTGSACLSLPPSATTAGLSATFTLVPTCGNDVYLLTAWISTQSSGASWSIAVGDGTPIQAAIPDTNGTWQFFSQSVETGSLTSVTVTMSATNAGTAPLLVDDLAFAPLACRFGAQVYDAVSENVTASLQSNGVTIRRVYDEYQRPIAYVGPDEVVRSLVVPYSSLQGNPAFSASDPNSTLSVVPAGGGFLDDFSDGAWQDSWSGDASAWLVDDGWLEAASGAATITLIDSANSADCGIAVQASASASSIAVGPVSVQCTQWAAQQSWQVTSGGSVLATQTTTQQSGVPAVVQTWVLLAVGNNILFYADGQQIFAVDTGAPVSGAVSLTAGSGGGFANVIVLDLPLLSMQYTDGAGRLVQQQQLDYSSGPATCVVTQTLHDPADPQGRAAVTTRNGSSASTLFAYQPGFATMDWTDGTMTGAIATQDSADGGYPFRRVVFESSPVGRPIEVGLPSAPYAIGATGSHTLQTSYFGAPASAYPQPSSGSIAFGVTQTTNQNGEVAYVIRDQRRRVTCTGVAIPNATGVQYEQVQYAYDPAGRMDSVVPPAGEATSFTYDFLGRVIAMASPDTGTSQFVWDPAGRLRFLQDANGAAGGWYSYKKYDFLGRLIEDGQIAGSFDPAALQLLADEQPSQPEAPQYTCVWRKRITYDGDGTNPGANLVGRRWLLESSSGSDGAASVTEERSYDTNGNILTDALTVPQFGPSAETINYSYDSIGRVTLIDYGTPLQVSYTYNDLGQLASIGDPAGAADAYASYAYDADGRVLSETRNGGSLTFPHTWVSTGWPLTIGDPTSPVSLTLGYGGAYNGEITSISRSSAAAPSTSLQTAYTYDLQGRVIAATSAQIGTEPSAIEYDANGNLLSVSTSSATDTYAYAANTNLLQTITDTSSTTFTYDANGNVLAASGGRAYAIHYDPVTGMPASVTGAETVTFVYGPNNERVLKTSGLLTRLYVRGQNAMPLVEQVQPLGEIAFASNAYVYGPDGLVAAVIDGETYAVLADHEGSTRAVFDNAGTLVAGYDYLPYGAAVQSYGHLSGLFSYLYTGQELDRETGLYNYRARLFDPVIGRFLQPDPDWQFASPYVYAGDDPILLVDPTGELSIWGEVFLDIGLAVVAAAGIALSVVSGGASLAGFAAVIGGGLLSGAGISGFIYTTKEGPSGFKWGKFGETVGIGAAAGAVGGAVTQGAAGLIGASLGVTTEEGAFAFEEADVAAETSEAGEQAAEEPFVNISRGQGLALSAPKVLTAFSSRILGAVVNDVTSTVLQNVVNGQPLNSGLGTAILEGVGTGVASGALSVGLGDVAENTSAINRIASYIATNKITVGAVAFVGADLYAASVGALVAAKKF